MFRTSTLKAVTTCFQVWHPKTIHSDPFHVLWVFQLWMSSPFLSLEACLLRTKSVYWDNPIPFSLPVLCVFAVRIDGGKVVERSGIQKGDDWGINWEGDWEGVVPTYLRCLESSTWFIRKFQVPYKQVKYFRNMHSSYVCFVPLKEIGFISKFLYVKVGIT